MKIGFHRIGAAGGWRELMAAGSWGGVLVDDFGPAADIAATWPGATVVGRIVEADASLDPVNDYQRGISPETAAAWFVGRQEEKYRLNPAVKIWTGPNEPALSHGPNPDLPLDECLRRMAWFASFESRRLELLAGLDLRGVVGNFSTGTPDFRLWSAFIPALQSAVAHNGFLGLHEYMGAKPGFGVGDNPLRYRNVPEIKQTGVQVVMTEFGFDRVQGPPGYVTGAWRDLADQWIAHGDTTDPERYCADAYIWYGEELRKDPYVVGAAIFTSGNAGNDIWARHDIAGTRIPGYLRDYGNNLPPLEDDMAGELYRIGVCKIEPGRSLTRRKIDGMSIVVEPAGKLFEVYRDVIHFEWTFGDNRLLIVGTGGESLWQDPNTPSVRFL